jgi:hypothetical protein
VARNHLARAIVRRARVALALATALGGIATWADRPSAETTPAAPTPASTATAAAPDPTPASVARAAASDPVTVHVFHRDPIRFAPADSASLDTGRVRARDRGREIERTARVPAFDHPVRILARVATHPIPQDAATVCDKWDRAGDVRLVVPGAPDVEIVKFMTAYGGETTHELDVTHLAPLLRGECTFVGFVDTWVTPAWTMDFSLTFEPWDAAEPPEWMREWIEEEDLGSPTWARPLLFETFTAASMANGDHTITVEVPQNLRRVTLYYLVSGHCTDGRDADEFVTKDNVITIDGVEAHRFRPWRDDCRRFRDVNPHCRRWFDGSWSADFSRSGWCPGDAVKPGAHDVTKAMAAGAHDVAFRVEDIRPEDEGGHGYWRVSAVLAGWGDR